jgi:hypothetical protein
LIAFEVGLLIMPKSMQQVLITILLISAVIKVSSEYHWSNILNG